MAFKSESSGINSAQMSDFSPSSAKLEARNVGVQYFMPRTGRFLVALKDINLKIREGEFVSIVGPSGCGKTTFLNAVDGLLKVSAGQLMLNNKVINKPGSDRAMVFQTASLLPWRSVMNNIMYGLELQGRDKKRSQDRVKELIRLVGLEGFELNYPAELSGGMQQRVNLARALAVDPEILLLDEPFAALDAQTREVMQEELLKVWAQTHKTALFITHQIDEAVYLSDRVIVFSGRPGTVKASLDIDIPRPRPGKLNAKRDPRFHAYEDQIWSLIHDEVEKQAGMIQSKDDKPTKPTGHLSSGLSGLSE